MSVQRTSCSLSPLGQVNEGWECRLITPTLPLPSRLVIRSTWLVSGTNLEGVFPLVPSRPVRTLALWLTSGWDWERNRRQTLGDRQGGSGLDGRWNGPRTRGSHSRQAERVARHQREGSSTGRLVRLSHTSANLLACALTCSGLSYIIPPAAGNAVVLILQSPGANVLPSFYPNRYWSTFLCAISPNANEDGQSQSGDSVGHLAPRERSETSVGVGTSDGGLGGFGETTPVVGSPMLEGGPEEVELRDLTEIDLASFLEYVLHDGAGQSCPRSHADSCPPLASALPSRLRSASMSSTRRASYTARSDQTPGTGTSRPASSGSPTWATGPSRSTPSAQSTGRSKMLL